LLSEIENKRGLAEIIKLQIPLTFSELFVKVCLSLKHSFRRFLDRLKQKFLTGNRIYTALGYTNRFE
jgi:hypothetical protein